MSCFRRPEVNLKSFCVLVLSLVSLLAVAKPEQSDLPRIVHGPFENLIYQVHAYHDDGGELVLNDVFANSGAMSGYEGVENGQQITYPLKTSSDVRRYIDEHMNPLHNN